MTTKQEFAKFMVTLAAAMPRFAPNTGDPNILEAWYAELGHLDFATLQRAYKQAVAKCDAFPSIRQLLEFSGVTQSDEDKGREVGERIWSALSKFGSVNGNGEQATEKLQRIAEYLGPIGHDVVRMQGGWNNLCELATNDNAIALKAQWRELAEVITRKGGIGEAPDFARLPPNAAIAELCAKFQH